MCLVVCLNVMFLVLQDPTGSHAKFVPYGCARFTDNRSIVFHLGDVHLLKHSPINVFLVNSL